MVEEECKHQNKRKMFYRTEKSWVSTDFAICPECNIILKISEAVLKNE